MTKEVTLTFESSYMAKTQRRKLYSYREAQRQNLILIYKNPDTPCKWDEVQIEQVGPTLRLSHAGAALTSAKMEVKDVASS